MSHNRLMQLPRGVRGWTRLRRLHLGGNTLSVLPDEFCRCHSLENLNLVDNQLVSLPDEFGHLSNLMSLRLDRNKLTAIPASTYVAGCWCVYPMVVALCTLLSADRA